MQETTSPRHPHALHQHSNMQSALNPSYMSRTASTSYEADSPTPQASDGSDERATRRRNAAFDPFQFALLSPSPYDCAREFNPRLPEHLRGQSIAGATSCPGSIQFSATSSKAKSGRFAAVSGSAVLSSRTDQECTGSLDNTSLNAGKLLGDRYGDSSQGQR